MGSWSALLLAYLLGGLTFIPLVILSVLAHAAYTFPVRHDLDAPQTAAASSAGSSASTTKATSDTDDKDGIVQPGDETSALEESRKDKRDGDSKKSRGSEHMDVASGYFAVCREYTPMGINAKPIERSTPVGSTTVAAPSPSVYQSMYRSIFERKAVPSGAGENSGMSQRPKKAGNVFYVVLRHGHLMLFDDEEQIEVRHVISLAHHDVSVYSGGDVTPEGELWIKRNAICLSRKTDGGDLGPDSQLSKPFYLFSENCSAKEDFYFALLKNQEQTFPANSNAPRPKHFDVKHIISLVQKLHSTEDNVHSRWVNAVIGRVFLGIYRTKDLETFITEKITKKISRVKKPSFLTNLNIQRIHTGEAAPYFSNFKLKDLTVEGECVVEADVRYTGNFRIEVAATIKIDLGTRFKAREVNLVLAVSLKKIEGHVLFKIKPPPSNRVWVSFQTMPKMDMTLEPIVSSRQITYTVIIRQIENRIKEVLAETLVQPFWDDIPFFKTEHKNWRGGIFEGDDAVISSEPSADQIAEEKLAQTGDVEGVETSEEGAGADLLAETRPMEKSYSMPIVDAPQPSPTGLFGRKLNRSAQSPASASSTSIDTKPPTSAAPSPKILHQSTEPVVGTDAAHADLYKPSTSPPDHATNYMAAIHSRSTEASAPDTPSASPGKLATLAQTPSHSSASSAGTKDEEKEEHETTPIPERRNTVSSVGSNKSDAESHTTKTSFKDQAGSIGRSFFMRRENSNLSLASTSGDSAGSSQKKNTLAAVTNAAVQARQWGWNAIQRGKEARKNSDAAGQPVDLSQPMGRGQPLPPPGTPLPGPTNGRTKIGPVNVPKRKPVPSQSNSDGSSEETASSQTPPPQPPRRRRGASHDEEAETDQGMLVVAIPDDSEPETPGVEDKTDFLTAGETSEVSTVAEVGDDKSSRATTQTAESSIPDVEAEHVRDPVLEKELEKELEKKEEIEKTPSPPAPAIEASGPMKTISESEDTLPEASTATLIGEPLGVPAGEVRPQAAERVEPTSKATAVEMPSAEPQSTTATAEDDDDYSGWMDDSTDMDLDESTEKVQQPSSDTPDHHDTKTNELPQDIIPPPDQADAEDEKTQQQTIPQDVHSYVNS